MQTKAKSNLQSRAALRPLAGIFSLALTLAVHAQTATPVISEEPKTVRARIENPGPETPPQAADAQAGGQQ